MRNVSARTRRITLGATVVALVLFVAVAWPRVRTVELCRSCGATLSISSIAGFQTGEAVSLDDQASWMLGLQDRPHVHSWLSFYKLKLGLLGRSISCSRPEAGFRLRRIEKVREQLGASPALDGLARTYLLSAAGLPDEGEAIVRDMERLVPAE